MTMIFRVILLLIHCVVSLKDSFVFVWCRLIKLSNFKRNPVSVGDIKNNVSHLKKLPVHLGIVVVEDELYVTDIAKIVAWAMAAGISYITIYDHKGHCKKNEEIMIKKLEEQKEKLLGNVQFKKNSLHSQCAGLLETVPDGTHRTISGKCPLPTASIRTVGPEDGRQHLVNVARQLSHRLANNEISSDDINVPFVDANIREKNSFPDPDLVIKFGAVDSLMGFLPWQLRLSEILSLPTHHHIDFSSFVAALNRFGYTEQRYGK